MTVHGLVPFSCLMVASKAADKFGVEPVIIE
jgi:hypothetical protein